MDLKQQILDLISQHAPNTLNIQLISNLLDMHKTSDFININKVLSELEDDYIIVRNQKNCYSLAALANTFKGVLKVNNYKRAYIDHEGIKYYIDENDLKSAMHLDEVVYKLDVDNHSAKITKILKAYRTFIVGTFHKGPSKRYFFDADDTRLSKRIRVLNQKDFKIVDGIKAKAKIVKIKEYIEVEIDEIIGHENDPSVDVSAILIENNIPLEFEPKVLKEANDIEMSVDVNQHPKRHNLIDLLTVTIDGDDSKDFDDAISIEKDGDNYRLYVHIADVSYYVKENSALDNEAYKRGTSTYVVDRVVPMLPHVLSNGICSLVPNENRLTMTCEMVINNHGDIVDYKIYESIINSNYRMTYNNVNRILDKDVELMHQYDELLDMIDVMFELSQIIRKRRFDDGAIDFEKDEAKFKMNKNGKIDEIILRDRGHAEKLIEDFMISANICVARHTKWTSIPSLYRIHEKPKMQQLEQFVNIAYLFDYKFKGQINKISSKNLQACLDHFKNKDEYLIIKTLLLRSMTKARYDAQCLGHYGLGLEEYTHFTSPIRRYPDLIVHRMLRKYLINEKYDEKGINKDNKKMDKYGVNTSLAERRSVEAERAVNDMKVAEYMEDHVGEIFEGIVSSVVPFGFFVELPNTVEGLVHISSLNGHFEYIEDDLSLVSDDGKTIYQLGQHVKIKCVNANKLKRQVDFEIWEKKKRNQRWI